MNETKVELLAPAGNMECFLAAINAGADAVYLAGSRFGARAYAGNFSEEEVIKAICYAHLFGKKVYLTINTILKETELGEVYDYILPFYRMGLDAVIVQDFGVMKIIHNSFPDMEIHASTQMTVTGMEGAKLLKEYGVSRIVPARELSLNEIVEIKKEVSIEIETFVHGAMCYGYSGQCLFSSILGGRSGNRGRCAGPCRLPYDVLNENGKCINTKDTQYVLSMKDMCALTIMPQLIQSGIDSFKIEGRMKSAEYVFFVTSMYRKYLDRYYNKNADWKVDKKDLDSLSKSYLRGGLEEGYYQKHNAASMISLSKACYETNVAEGAGDVATVFPPSLAGPMKKQIRGEVRLNISEPVSMLLECEGVTVTCEGEMVARAEKRPLLREDIEKQIGKTGDTDFVFADLQIVAEKDVFLGLKALNELRRNALEQLREKLLLHTYRNSEKKYEYEDNGKIAPVQGSFLSNGISVSVSDANQLRLFLETDMVKKIRRVYIPFALYQNNAKTIKNIWKEDSSLQIVISFPLVVRKKAADAIKQFFQLADLESVYGFVIGNLEVLQIVKNETARMRWNKILIAGPGLYLFNSESSRFLWDYGVTETILSYELNEKEIYSLTDKMRQDAEIVVYGNIPLMVTANCVKNTLNQCGKDFQVYLKDRYQKQFSVVTDCYLCENTIYNCVPLSLHNEGESLKKNQICRVHMLFTTETPEEIKKIFAFMYSALFQGEKGTPPYKDFTKGHFKRGVE